MDRRRFLQQSVCAATLPVLPSLAGAAEAALTPTPRQTAGPFYPRSLPLDQDNDLVAVRGSTVTALGVITNVFGRVLDECGRPVSDARVEIWQCNAHGRYNHPDDNRNVPLDPGFQGFGRYVTVADGRYRFRTIRPVPYGWRTPHIHFRLSGPGFSGLTTQMYVAGEPRNSGDGVLSRIRDPAARASVLVEFVPDTLGDAELQAVFDIVLATDGRFD